MVFRLCRSWKSNFSQLKYVLAEIETENINSLSTSDNDQREITFDTTESIKIKLLNDQINILNESNRKFVEENIELASQNKNLIELFMWNRKVWIFNNFIVER